MLTNSDENFSDLEEEQSDAEISDEISEEEADASDEDSADSSG